MLARSLRGGQRDAIVSIALGEVGKVLDTDRGDGRKVGADRLKTY